MSTLPSLTGGLSYPFPIPARPLSVRDSQGKQQTNRTRKLYRVNTVAAESKESTKSGACTARKKGGIKKLYKCQRVPGRNEIYLIKVSVLGITLHINV